MSENFKINAAVQSDWLGILDAYICSKLFNFIVSENLPSITKLCEIGVWKGDFLFNILDNLELSINNIELIAIDPYPKLEKIREKFLFNINKKELGSKFILYANYDSIDKSHSLGLNFMHIDGKHTESAVYKDLEFANSNMAEGGIIVIDDIFHENYIGVTSGVFKFIHNSELVPFLNTRNKLYVVNKKFHYYYYNFMIVLLNDSKINFSVGKVGEIVSKILPYDEESTVKGFNQITVRPKKNKDFKATLIKRKSYFSKFLSRVHVSRSN